MKSATSSVALSRSKQARLQAADLVKVGGKPVHDNIEGVVEGEVVDDNSPDGRVGQHAPPGGRGGAPLLASFLG